MYKFNGFTTNVIINIWIIFLRDLCVIFVFFALQKTVARWQDIVICKAKTVARWQDVLW